MFHKCSIYWPALLRQKQKKNKKTSSSVAGIKADLAPLLLLKLPRNLFTVKMLLNGSHRYLYGINVTKHVKNSAQTNDQTFVFQTTENILALLCVTPPPSCLIVQISQIQCHVNTFCIIHAVSWINLHQMSWCLNGIMLYVHVGLSTTNCRE